MPRTVEQHKLNGTFRKDRHGKPVAAHTPEPTPVVAGRPRCPSHLGPEARQEFRRISKILGARRSETEGDFAVLAIYAEVYSRWVEAKAVLADEGLRIVVEVADSHGHVRSKRINNPLIPVVADLERRLLTLVKAMGLTPDSRKSVEPVEPPTPTPEPNDLEQPPDWLLN